MWLLALVSLALARADIAVIVSDTLAAYDAPVERFAASVGRPTTIFDLRGDRARATAVVEQLAADPPPLVFAVGAKAAYVAVNELAGVPVVYAMVRDPERYGVRGTRVTGVSDHVPADAALAQFRIFAPDVERLGVILSTGNTAASTTRALDAARSAGFSLEVQRITNPRDVRAAFGRVAGAVDALWLLPDANVITPSGFRWLREETRRRQLPMLAATENLVQAGASLCVAANRDVVGQQAAELARRILDGGELPGVIEPPAPGAIRVVLNRPAMDAIGLRVDPVMLDFVDEVVEEGRSR